MSGLRSLDDGFIPPILELSRLDRKLLVPNRDALVMTRRLAAEEGIFAGVSSGAVIHTCMRVAAKMTRGTIVGIVCDGGWKYLSSGLWTDDLDEVEDTPRPRALLVDAAEDPVGHGARNSSITRSPISPTSAAGWSRARTARRRRVFRAANSEGSPFMYVMDPREQMRIMEEIDEAGQDLLAIYHSHTRSAAYPSRTDVELAFFPGHALPDRLDRRSRGARDPGVPTEPHRPRGRADPRGAGGDPVRRGAGLAAVRDRRVPRAGGRRAAGCGGSDATVTETVTTGIESVVSAAPAPPTTATAPSAALGADDLPPEDAVAGVRPASPVTLATASALVDKLYAEGDPNKPAGISRFEDAGYAGAIVRDQPGRDTSAGLALLRSYAIALRDEAAARREVAAGVDEVRRTTPATITDVAGRRGARRARPARRHRPGRHARDDRCSSPSPPARTSTACRASARAMPPMPQDEIVGAARDLYERVTAAPCDRLGRDFLGLLARAPLGLGGLLGAPAPRPGPRSAAGSAFLRVRRLGLGASSATGSAAASAGASSAAGSAFLRVRRLGLGASSATGSAGASAGASSAAGSAFLRVRRLGLGASSATGSAAASAGAASASAGVERRRTRRRAGAGLLVGRGLRRRGLPRPAPRRRGPAPRARRAWRRPRPRVPTRDGDGDGGRGPPSSSARRPRPRPRPRPARPSRRGAPARGPPPSARGRPRRRGAGGAGCCAPAARPGPSRWPRRARGARPRPPGRA